MATRKKVSKKKVARKKASRKTRSLFCPRCGSGKLRKSGFTNSMPKKQRFRCKSCKHTTTMPSSTPIQMRTKLPRRERYIVTAAQNATPIHKGFWKALHHCADYYDAELVVIPGRYKNPTSMWTKENEKHEWWAAEVEPYLITGSIDINERLVVLGGAKIQWAAQSALTSMDAVTKDKSGIVGHGSRAMRSIATPQHQHPKIMYTTGACTVDGNYTDTKRGFIANFNHCLGALLIEVEGDVFYVRQLNATKRGHFIDLDTEFTQTGVRKAKRAKSVTLGDVHYRFINEEVKEATFNRRNGLIKLVNPEYMVLHDVVDFHSENHHHKGDWLVQYAKYKEGMDNVRQEFNEAISFINEYTPKNTTSVIVSSNHDRAARIWLREKDFRTDPVNADFYLEMTKDIMATARRTPGGVTYDEPFIVYGQKLARKNVKFLHQGESFVIDNVEYGFHGDSGPNGSRGSTMNLSKMGIKVTKGHSHTAEIINGCYSVGKCTGMLEYEIGSPSSHTNSHVVHYANGKRAIVTIVNGKFCLTRPSLAKYLRKLRS